MGGGTEFKKIGTIVFDITTFIYDSSYARNTKNLDTILDRDLYPYAILTFTSSTDFEDSMYPNAVTGAVTEGTTVYPYTNYFTPFILFLHDTRDQIWSCDSGGSGTIQILYDNSYKNYYLHFYYTTNVTNGYIKNDNVVSIWVPTTD